MAKKVPGYAVSFATRYATPVGGWLSAYAALARMEMLLDDLRTLRENLDIAVPEDTRWSPWFGADVISYYSVGYITCLEWHARSRLVDLLSYKPDAAKADDVKQIRDAVVLDMISANVTVASIIGASTNISSFDAYINVFGRVFEALNIPLQPFEAIKLVNQETGQPWISGDEIEDLRNLYKFRNSLVHEIDATRIGHANIRDSWDPEEATRIGNIVLNLIQSLEIVLTQNAPRDFPNLLSADGFPLSRYEVMLNELPILEERIEEYFDGLTDTPPDKDPDWKAAKRTAAQHLKTEAKFISETLFLHYRYEDLREPLKAALVKSRHDYLTTFLKVLGAVWQAP